MMAAPTFVFEVVDVLAVVPCKAHETVRPGDASEASDSRSSQRSDIHDFRSHRRYARHEAIPGFLKGIVGDGNLFAGSEGVEGLAKIDVSQPVPIFRELAVDRIQNLPRNDSGSDKRITGHSRF
jgi:hypothetical protein